MRPGPLASVMKTGMPGEHPLERALERLEPDLDRRVLPEQDVVLEIDRHVAQLEVQHGHQLALDVIGDAAEGLVVRRGRQL